MDIRIGGKEPFKKGDPVSELMRCLKCETNRVHVLGICGVCDPTIWERAIKHPKSTVELCLSCGWKTCHEDGKCMQCHWKATQRKAGRL